MLCFILSLSEHILKREDKLKKHTFFSASSVSRKFFTARCKALTVWFLFQNDANLYLTLPGNGMKKWGGRILTHLGPSKFRKENQRFMYLIIKERRYWPSGLPNGGTPCPPAPMRRIIVTAGLINACWVLRTFINQKIRHICTRNITRE